MNFCCCCCRRVCFNFFNHVNENQNSFCWNIVQHLDWNGAKDCFKISSKVANVFNCVGCLKPRHLWLLSTYTSNGWRWWEMLYQYICHTTPRYDSILCFQRTEHFPFQRISDVFSAVNYVIERLHSTHIDTHIHHFTSNSVKLIDNFFLLLLLLLVDTNNYLRFTFPHGNKSTSRYRQ